MNNVKEAPNGSPEVIITINVPDAALEEIKIRADSEQMSIDKFIVFAGYFNPATLSVQFIHELQSLCNSDDSSIKHDIDLIKDMEIRKQVSECFERFNVFLCQKYENVFFDCTTDGIFTSDKHLTGVLRSVTIEATELAKENLEMTSRLFGMCLNEYLLFATTYEMAYIRPIDLKEGIPYLNEMMSIATLVSDTALRRKLKCDILELCDRLKFLCEASANHILYDSCKQSPHYLPIKII